MVDSGAPLTAEVFYSNWMGVQKPVDNVTAWIYLHLFDNPKVRAQLRLASQPCLSTLDWPWPSVSSGFYPSTPAPHSQVSERSIDPAP